MNITSKVRIVCILACLSYWACGQDEKRKTADPPSKEEVIIDKAYKETQTGPKLNADTFAYDAVVPKAAMSTIRTLLPGWNFPGRSRYERVFFDYYAKNSMLINFIHGDFNCDGIEDYSAILESSHNQLTAWVIHSTNGTYTAVMLEKMNSTSEPINVGLVLVPKGKLRYLDNRQKSQPRPIDLACNAITVLTLESSAQTYYWKNNTYLSVFTAD